MFKSTISYPLINPCLYGVSDLFILLFKQEHMPHILVVKQFFLALYRLIKRYRIHSIACLVFLSLDYQYVTGEL